MPNILMEISTGELATIIDVLEAAEDASDSGELDTTLVLKKLKKFPSGNIPVIHDYSINKETGSTAWIELLIPVPGDHPMLVRVNPDSRTVTFEGYD